MSDPGRLPSQAFKLTGAPQVPTAESQLFFRHLEREASRSVPPRILPSPTKVPARWRCRPLASVTDVLSGGVSCLPWARGRQVQRGELDSTSAANLSRRPLWSSEPSSQVWIMAGFCFFRWMGRIQVENTSKMQTVTAFLVSQRENVLFQLKEPKYCIPTLSSRTDRNVRSPPHVRAVGLGGALPGLAGWAPAVPASREQTSSATRSAEHSALTRSSILFSDACVFKT